MMVGLEPLERPEEIKVLKGLPALLSLYGKAVTPSASSALHKVESLLPLGKAQPTVDASHSALPDLAYVARGVTFDAVKLREYQELLGYPKDDSVPAGFAHVTAFPVAMALMVSAEFPLQLLGMVHLANRIEVAQPLDLSDKVEVVAWAKNLSGHAKGTSVELVAEIHRDTEIVWRGISTYLAKGKFLKGKGGEATEREAFEPGFPTGQWELGAGTGRAYAAVSGDVNPIHLSALSAKALGFPKAIAHGMFTAAKAFAQSPRVYGNSYVWTVEFAKPVLLPGKVSVSITSRPARGEDQASEAGGSAAGTPGSTGGATATGETVAVDYSGWKPRTGQLHFKGAITPLKGH